MKKSILFLTGFALGFSIYSNTSYAQKEERTKKELYLELKEAEYNPFQPLKTEDVSLEEKKRDLLVTKNKKLAKIEKTILPIKSNKIISKERIIKKTHPKYKEEIYKIKNGHTLIYFLKKSKISKKEIKEILYKTKNIKKLTNLRINQIIKIQKNKDNFLHKIILEKNEINTIQLVKKEGKFSIKEIDYKYDIVKSYIEGTINGSLYVSARKQGLTKDQINALINIFEWSIDFKQELKKGDKFAILFEEKYREGKKVGNGKILSAEFSLSNDTYKAFLFTDQTGKDFYYNSKGESLKKAFIRNPIEFARISSKFNPRRLHPIFKTVRPHRGVDYAAMPGTPIRSTGDGTVKFVGRKGGYGKVVILEHGNKYTTLYAHMSRFKKGIKRGQRISQKEIIGYVGSTGASTAPHLHYEFRINGVHKDPLKIKFPNSEPIPIKHASKFKKQKNSYISSMNNYKNINKKKIYTANKD